ncbi:unnamed protein product [Somion occarium]|uniref:Uncharacterized protein n=1 Tax=Somion occarium TaxID=3059160 RepID=A0ABP1D4N5_9APHY
MTYYAGSIPNYMPPVQVVSGMPAQNIAYSQGTPVVVQSGLPGQPMTAGYGVTQSPMVVQSGNLPVSTYNTTPGYGMNAYPYQGTAGPSITVVQPQPSYAPSQYGYGGYGGYSGYGGYGRLSYSSSYYPQRPWTSAVPVSGSRDIIIERPHRHHHHPHHHHHRRARSLDGYGRRSPYYDSY